MRSTEETFPALSLPRIIPQVSIVELIDGPSAMILIEAIPVAPFSPQVETLVVFNALRWNSQEFPKHQVAVRFGRHRLTSIHY